MKVYELLESPAKWLQDAYAVDEQGKDCAAREGVAWCLMGALDKCDPTMTGGYPDRLYDALEAQGYDGIGDWNDEPTRRWEDVVALARQLDRSRKGHPWRRF